MVYPVPTSLKITADYNIVIKTKNMQIIIKDCDFKKIAFEKLLHTQKFALPHKLLEETKLIFNTVYWGG